MSSDKKRRELGGLTQVIILTNSVIQIFRENYFFLVSTYHFDGIFMQQFEFFSNYLKKKYCSRKFVKMLCDIFILFFRGWIVALVLHKTRYLLLFMMVIFNYLLTNYTKMILISTMNMLSMKGVRHFYIFASGKYSKFFLQRYILTKF